MKTTTKRRLAAVAAPMLLALSLTACGGASSAPDDASEDDFCEAFNNGIPPGAEDIDTDDTDAQVDAVHDYADDLKDAGTPDGFSDEERNGFEVLVDTYSDIDSGDVEDADSDEDFGVSDDDQEDVGKFIAKATEVCGGAELPDSGDLEDELPSDLPS